MTRAVARSGAIILCASLLQSCGGGGSDDGDSGGNPPPPPPPPTQTLVQMMQGNAEPVGILTFGPANDALWAMQELVNATRYLGFEQLAPQTFNCVDGGTVQLEVQDSAPTASLGAQDRIIIAYASCSGTTSGTLVLEIASIAFQGGDIVSLDGEVTMGLSLLNLPGVLEGSGMLAYRATSSGLSWLGTGFAVSLTTSGQEESMSDGRVEKIVTGSPFRYSVTIEGTIDSDFLDGRFTFETDEAFEGDEGQWPDSGSLIAHGNADSLLRIRAASVQGSVSYEVDADGNGILDNVGSGADWLDINFGLMFGRRGEDDLPAPLDPPDVLGRHIALGASGEGLAVDSVRGRIYVTVPARNELLVFSAGSLEVLRRVNVGSRPNGVSLSADSEKIFVGLGAAGSVAVVDSDTFAFSHIYVAPELEHSRVFNVVETAPGILYTGTGLFETGRVARIDRGNGTVMAAGGPDSSSGEIELLADPGRGVLYVGNGRGAGVPALRKYDATFANSPQLLAATDALPLHSTEHMSLSPSGSRLYLESGQVIDTSDFSEVGHIAAGVPWAMPNGLEIMVGQASGGLELRKYSATSLGVIDSVDTDCELGAEAGGFADLDRMAPSPVEGQWAFLGGNVLCVIDLLNPTEPPGTGLPGVEPEPLPIVKIESIGLSLPGPSNDAEYDAARDRLYVSVPFVGEVVTIDVTTHQVIERDVLGNEPRGLDLSPDGSTLAIMFHGNGNIGFKDLASGDTEMRDLTSFLGTTAGNDVVWVADDAIFATPDAPCCETPAYLVRTSFLDPDATRRSAGGLNFGSQVELTASPDGAFLYMTNGSDFVRKLDLSLPDEPVVRTFQQYSSGLLGTLTRPSISPNGGRLAFSNGAVLRADDLFQAGQVGDLGMALYGPDGNGIFSAVGSKSIDRYAAATFIPDLRWEITCAGNSPARMFTNAAANEFMTVSQSRVCFWLLEHQSPESFETKARSVQTCRAACLARQYHKRNSAYSRGWHRTPPPRPVN